MWDVESIQGITSNEHSGHHFKRVECLMNMDEEACVCTGRAHIQGPALPQPWCSAYAVWPPAGSLGRSGRGAPSRQQTACSGQQAAGSRQQAAGSKLQQEQWVGTVCAVLVAASATASTVVLAMETATLPDCQDIWTSTYTEKTCSR